MKAKAIRFGRLSSSQFNERVLELNNFLADNSYEILGTPQITSNDEEGTVMFIFYKDREKRSESYKQKADK